MTLKEALSRLPDDANVRFLPADLAVRPFNNKTPAELKKEAAAYLNDKVVFNHKNKKRNQYEIEGLLTARIRYNESTEERQVDNEYMEKETGSGSGTN